MSQLPEEKNVADEREMSTQFCFEHGEVEPYYIPDSDVAWCPKCQRATSFDPEEAERFEHQDD